MFNVLIVCRAECAESKRIGKRSLYGDSDVPTRKAGLSWCTGASRWPPQYAPAPVTFDLFDLESGVRVTCDVGYLCANLGLPIYMASLFST